MAGKHTAGPWSLAVHTGRGGPIAPGDDWTIYAAGETYAIAYEGGHNPNADADARLIAAAPDLLEALIELRGFAARVADGVDAGSVEEYIEQADAAITRATQPLPPPNEE